MTWTQHDKPGMPADSGWRISSACSSPAAGQILDSGRFLVSSWRSFPSGWRHYAHRARAVFRSCAIHIVAWGFLCVGCWPVPARAQVAADAASATKPNIVIILADDLGWGDVKAMRPESTLATPRIDSIATAGMRFTDAHSAAAVCSPSRYALLTGRYGWRSRLRSDVLGDRARPLIDSDLPTLGSMLQQHGYRTAAIGKWHLGLRFPRLPPDEENDINRGFDWSGEIEGAPVGLGFDEFFGVSGNLGFHPRAFIRDDRITAYPDQPYTPTGLLPSHFRYVAPDFDPFEVLDRLTEEAVDFIDRSAGQENPFFLYFALTAPHVPLIPESRFVGTSGLGYYGDFVAQIDWIVGQVLDALARAGIADDTLLVFTSDNGSPMEDRPNWLATHHVTNPSADWYWSTVHKPNGDWRGIKSTIYEGGHRVPYLVRWPGVVPAGSETAFTFAHVDLYATVADILGHRLDDEEAIDSLSILPVMRGQQAMPRRSVVNHSAKGMFAVRNGPWKLVLGNGGGGWGGSGFIGTPFTRPYKLYDLSSTPWEGKNLIEEQRARADELEERLSTIRSSTKRSQLYSDDASLGALALSGIEIGEFAGEVWGYSAQVANKVTSTTVTATPAEEYATVVISDGKNSTVGTESTVELREGGNTIMVTVTAEDMVTTGTYAVVVARENAATGDPGLPGASPEITSGSSFTVVEGETAVVTLTATDTDTQESDLIWSLSGGAEQAKFIITNSGVLALGAAKDFEAPDDTNTDGVYQVTVQVSDGGRTDTADLTVTLANLNEAPTANAGEDQTGIGEGATVTLSGSGSDPDANDALTYAWTQTGGPSVPFFDSALAAPTLVAPTDLSSEATLTFTLRVTDEAGLYHEDETRVGVVSSAPLTAVFEGVPAFHDGMRGFEVWLRFNREVKLNSSAFTNGLLTVDGGWVRRASRLISGGRLWTVTVMPSGDWDVVITLPAGRACGTTGAVCTLDDRPLSAAASARVAGPAAPLVTGSTTLSVLEGETAVATLTASDADTSAMDLQWSIPSGSGGGADGGKFTITAGGALAFVTPKDFEEPDDADTDGSYQVTVQVSDSRRNGREDLTVTLSDRNEAPTADAGADRQDVEQGATVTLAGSGSDADADDRLTYAWTQIGGTEVTLSDATAPAPSFTAPAGLTEEATLTFSLKVTDKAGLYHEDAVSVRVKARPPPVATIAAAAGTVTEGAAATFTVSLDAPATAALPVAVSVSETGAALSGSSPATVDFAAGESSKTLSLATADDQVVEPDSTVTATVSLGAGYTVGTASSAFVRVEDEDTATFTVSAAPEAIAEGESATLTVAISNGVTFAEDQTVELAASGTASASDHTGVPAALTLAAGASSVTAGLAASEDQEEEEAETLTVTASHGGVSIGSAMLTIASVSHDASLRTLSLSGVDIGAFSADTTAYAASVAHEVASTTVTAAASHSAATVTIAPGSEVSLAEGANAITVTVVAEDGTTTRTYTVTVTRAAAPLSEDASLRTLSLSGVDIGAFSADSTAYAASVAHEVASTTVTAAASHSAATVSIEPGSEVSLAVGENEIAVTVTAEDGSTTRSYRVTVTRAEEPALPVVSVAAVEERLVGPIGEFRVSRTGPRAEALQVQVLFANSRSSRVQTLTIRLLPGQSSVTRRVQAGDNRLVEDDITVTWTLQESQGYTVSAEQGSASVVLEESDIPEFSVSVQPAGIAEGESAAVRVAIANGVRFREAQTIDLSVSGTASGSDYRGVPETLRLRAYKTSTTTRLTAAVDGEEEAEETVTITASHGGTEIGSATVTIAGTATPLTGRLVEMPETHDGETAFAFELRFSEEIRISYKTLRDTAFEVKEGVVRGARRLERPSNRRWEITVEPTSEADIELVLPVTKDCAAEGAVCTAAGKRLSQRLAATVPGPGTQASVQGFSLAPDNGRPSGIWSDGATAWVADVEDGKLFAYRLSDGERAPERDVAVGGSPMGLWSDGATLWVAELSGGLAGYRLSDGERLEGRDLALPVSGSPVGVWSDGATVWIAEWLGDTVHAYRLSDGERAPARDIRLAAGNLLPVGLWSDGETLWVADWDERMVAYRLSDGERAPERDVAAEGSDADPSGLWSDGETLLVTGWEGGEVRAHGLPAATAAAVRVGGGVGWAAGVPGIGDAALRAAIAAAGAEGLAELEVLDARHGGIRSLAGLEGAVNLKELDLGFNPLDDTEALAKLPSLRSLNLDGAAPDLSALWSLTGLERLSLRHNGVSDLSPLAGLAQLRELDVGDNRIEDLSPLAGLAGLTALRADRNRIVDLWPLASLPRLAVVDLGRNRIRDLQALAGLGRLRKLLLDGNGLSEPAPLAGLAGLRELGLAGNAVKDLGALSGLAGLRRLDLRGNPVRDLSPLWGLRSLGWVHVGASGIENLSPLDGAPELRLAGVDDRETPHQGGYRTQRTPGPQRWPGSSRTPARTPRK